MGNFQSGPKSSWLIAIPLGLALASCSGGSNDEPGAVRGEFKALVADYEDGTSQTLFQLETAAGDYYELIFDAPPEVAPGSELSVRGVVEGSQIRVESYHVLDSLGIGVEQQQSGVEQQEALSNPPPRQPLPPRKMAVVIFDSAMTVATARKRLLDDFDGLRQFYRENGYGWYNFTGDAFGPYTVSGCSTGSVANTGRQNMQKAGVNIAEYKHFLNYMSKSAGCGWGGLGEAGIPPVRSGGDYGNRTMKDTWYSATLGCVVLNQEVGHNFGLQHPHFCSSGPFKGGCPGYSEYGDPFTPIGTGCGHLSAVEAGELGFINSHCNTVHVEGGGTYEIGPIELACDGPQVLRWKESTQVELAEYGYLEYRKKLGHDTKLEEGIYIHYGADYKSPKTLPWTTPANGASAFLVLKKAIKAGESWKSLGGFEFKVVSLGDTAKIQITGEGGSAKCWEDGKAAPPKPTKCEPVPKDDGTTGGTGGTGGAGGGGGGQTGGGGGSAGQAGSAGASGGGGTGNVGGQSSGGKGGSTAGGSGGAAGSGGSAGSLNGGAGAGGSGGKAGGAGTGGQTDPPPEGDCGCRLPGHQQQSPSHHLLALGLLGWIGAYRRKTQRWRRKRFR